MPIITKAGLPVKGSATQFTLDKTELLLLVSDAYFSDVANWKEVQLRYKSSSGKQKEIITFDAAISPCVGNFSVSLKAKNEFLIHSIVIKDFDNGSLEIPRSALITTDFDVVLDNVAPTILSISPPIDGSYSAVTVPPYLFFDINFSESVIVTGSPILKLDIGGVEKNASYISGSGSSSLVFRYTVLSTDNDSDGIDIVSLDLNSGTIKDAAGNNANLSFSTQALNNVLVDNVSPTISSINGPANGTYKLNNVLSFTVNFSEEIIVIGSPILKLDIGGVEKNATYISGSGTSSLLFRHTITSGSTDADGIQVTSLILNSGTIKDFANNSANLSFSTQTFSNVLVDGIVPTISSISGPANGTYVTNDVLSFTVNFSENVTVIAGPTPKLVISLSGTSRDAFYVSGSGSSALIFQYTVVSADDADLGISVLQLYTYTAIRDAAGNSANPSFSSVSFSNVLIDNVSPTISSISGPANGTYVTNDVLSFTVNFSENVIVTGSPILKLDIGGVEKNASYISGSGSTGLVFRYTVASGDNDSDGVQATSLVLNSGTVKDAANNNANLSFLTQTFSNVLVDATAPTISSISGPANGTYVAAQNLSFTVNFSENVIVTGSPILKLDIGGVEKNASYISGSYSSSLVFRYTVASGDNDSDGVQATSLILNSGTVKDAANNNANLTFSTQTFSEVLVDATAPTISSISGPANGTYVAAQNLSFTVNFSENVIVTGSPILKINLDGIERNASYTTTINGSSLVFSYTVTGFLDVDINGVQATSLILNGGTIKDAANNNANLSFSTQTFNDALVGKSFGLIDYIGLDSTITRSLVLPDNSVIYVGSFTSYQDSSNTILSAPRIIKFLSTGDVDTSFMSNIQGGFNSFVNCISTDGTSLYVGGSFTSFNGIANNARFIAKLSTSGVFDTTFSNNLDVVSGTKATTSGFNTSVSSIAISGANLYVGGNFTNFKGITNNARYIAKLSTSGVFDTAFSDNLDVVSGTKAFTSGFNFDSTAIVTDGTSLYVGGNFTSFKTISSNANGIAKLSTSGVFDTAFSDNLDVVSGTKATTSGFGGAATPTNITIDGTSLYIGGNFTTFKGITNNARYIAKLSTSGVFDTTFSNNLDVVSGTKAATSGFESSISHISTKDTNLYINGSFTSFKNSSCGSVAKIDTNGTRLAYLNFNSNFNSDGVDAVTDGLNTYIVGSFTHYNGIYSPGIAKILPTGNIDTVFASNLGSGLSGSLLCIAIDGTSLYIGGSFTSFNGITNNARYIAKLSTSGVFDTAFSNNLDVVSGTKAATSGFNNLINNIQVAGTSLYVGGSFTSFKGTANNANRIAKLSTSGVFDTAFSDNLDVVSGTKATTSGFGGTVNNIQVISTNLYIVGGFTSFKGTANNANSIAKLSTSGVFDTAFSNNLDVVSGTKATTSGFGGAGTASVIATDGTSLYVGGSFTTFKGTATNANRIAKLSTSGVFDTAFSDNLDVVSGTKATTSGFNLAVTCIAISGANLYVGGALTAFKGTSNNANRIAKLSTSGVFDTAFSNSLDLVSGTKATTSGFNASLNMIKIAGARLYATGSFTKLGNRVWQKAFITSI